MAEHGFFSPPRKKAVAYARNSDERQENSAEIQMEAIRAFASRHDVDVIAELVDDGVTGLTENRPAFLALMQEWVENPDAPEFQYVLVYDMSRFARFDPDKSAAMEYACKRRGKELITVLRGIPTPDQELAHYLLRAIERFTSADYVHVLSKKVKGGCIKVIQQGFSAGGLPPYGLDRLLVDERHQPVQILRPGEQKMISNQRVQFVPSQGQPAEVVRRIFSEFVHGARTFGSIAARLNADGIVSPGGKLWRAGMIRKVLANPSYVGFLTYNKTSGLLKSPRRRNSKKAWVVTPDAFPHVVDTALFTDAQERLRAHPPHGSHMERRHVRHLHEYMRRRTGKSALPILVSRGCLVDGTTRWCFLLVRKKAVPGAFLCIGLPDEEYRADAYIPGGETFFIIPSQDFGVGQYVVCEKGRSPHEVDRVTAEAFLVTFQTEK